MADRFPYLCAEKLFNDGPRHRAGRMRVPQTKTPERLRSVAEERVGRRAIAPENGLKVAVTPLSGPRKIVEEPDARPGEECV